MCNLEVVTTLKKKIQGLRIFQEVSHASRRLINFFKIYASNYYFWPYHKSTLGTKGDKFLKKPWCCVGGAVLQDNVILSTELIMKIGHRKEFVS